MGRPASELLLLKPIVASNRVFALFPPATRIKPGRSGRLRRLLCRFFFRWANDHYTEPLRPFYQPLPNRFLGQSHLPFEILLRILNFLHMRRLRRSLTFTPVPARISEGRAWQPPRARPLNDSLIVRLGDCRFVLLRRTAGRWYELQRHGRVFHLGSKIKCHRKSGPWDAIFGCPFLITWP